MDTIIPILPCCDMKAQTEFFAQLGFEIVKIYTRPNSYGVVRFGDLEIHFYGNRRLVPQENPSMCFLRVSNVDAIYAAFTGSLKEKRGSIPRSRIPRISKVKDLKDDRRFTLTDVSGNTYFVGSPHESSALRTLRHPEHAEKFAVLYDLLYSKEDPPVANNYLPTLLEIKAELDSLDRAKLLLVAAAIRSELGQPRRDPELEALLETAKDSPEADWAAVMRQYQDLYSDIETG